MASGMIVYDGIGPTLDFLIINAVQHAYSVMEQAGYEVEAYAQANAPWSDITGAARNTLNASVSVEGMEIILDLAHGVDYGYWLELIQDGNFAIIMPTLEAMGPAILNRAGNAVIGDVEVY